jgi:hypothetical protein
MLRRIVWGVVLTIAWWAGQPAQADLVVTEIMFDPASSPEGDWEYVEIYNSGPGSVNLAGYVFDDDDGTALTNANISTGIIPVGGAAVLHSTSLTAAEMQAAWGATPLFISVSNWSSLNNTGDRIGLWSNLASYGTRDFSAAEADVEFSVGSGWPTIDGVGSIYLTSLEADPSVGSNWDLSEVGVDDAYLSAAVGDTLVSNVGSPGALVPEPSGATLLVLALALAVCTRRIG